MISWWECVQDGEKFKAAQEASETAAGLGSPFKRTHLVGINLLYKITIDPF